MILFENFDLTNGFAIDYMHNAALGVTRLLIELWLGEHRLKNAYILPRDRILLNNRLTKLKPCSYVTRKPRSLEENKTFKASEYRNLLLYYLRFALTGLLGNDKVKHFELLSAATYMLLKSKISEREVIAAGEMLVKFANQFESIYGKEVITMNIHMLRHYADAVLQCGPLWAYSMFGFEEHLGTLKKSVHNGVDALDTISFDYCLNRAEVNTDLSERDAKMKKKVKLTLEEANKLIELNVDGLINGEFKVSDSIEISRHIYTSKKSRRTKSIDYFVQLKNETIGCVQFFVENRGGIFALVKVCAVIERHYHLLRINETDQFELFDSNDIQCKLMYMQIGCYKIVAREPNFYEST